MCPGRARSSGRVPGSMSAFTVVARSAALIPVVVPCTASTDTVNAVRCTSVLWATMSGNRNSSRCSPSIGMQITPLVWRIMNAIDSAVTFSAAMMRSPSFSRSASSTTTTSSPRWIAAIAFSMWVKGMTSAFSGDEEAFDVLGDHVGLQVDAVAGVAHAERGDREGVWDQRDAELGVVDGGDREAHAVDGDGALLDQVTREVGGCPHGDAGGAVGLRFDLHDLADAVDVAEHQVATQA